MLRFVRGGLLACSLFLGATGLAHGNIIAVTGATEDFEGAVTYKDTGGNVIVTGEGAILSTSQALAPHVIGITYDNNPHFVSSGGGLRLTEIVTNTSTATWTDFHLQLSGGAFFSDNFSPGLVTVTAPSGPSPVVQFTRQYNGGANGGEIVLSPDQTSLDLYNLAVAPGGTLDIHIPVQGLNLSGGSFGLTQVASVPEPASLALLGCCAAGLGGFAWRRRKTAPVA